MWLSPLKTVQAGIDAPRMTSERTHKSFQSDLSPGGLIEVVKRQKSRRQWTYFKLWAEEAMKATTSRLGPDLDFRDNIVSRSRVRRAPQTWTCRSASSTFNFKLLLCLHSFCLGSLSASCCSLRTRCLSLLFSTCFLPAHFDTMPPMSLIGQVTKVGYMNKTATVTVSRFIYHARTGKVCHPSYLSSCLVPRVTIHCSLYAECCSGWNVARSTLPMTRRTVRSSLPFL